MNTDQISGTVAEIVRRDLRMAPVLDSFGIDFCCHGNRKLVDACLEKGIDIDRVLKAMEAISRSHDQLQETTDFGAISLDLLADYIEQRHHRYAEKQMPIINKYLEKVVSVHSKNHPELKEVQNLFLMTIAELTAHMKKEEFMIFPYIRNMVHIKETGGHLSKPVFGSIRNPISVMELEHEAEGDRIGRIREITMDYQVPEDACKTFEASLIMLKEFEADLHVHIHLENNLLFPKAIMLEQELSN